MAEEIPIVTRARKRLQLRTLDPTDIERHASWLELFFDLVFVLAVAHVAKILAGQTDIAGFARYLFLFAPVWWSWIGYTFYADRFETDEAAYRIMMFAGMLGVLGLSLTLGNAFTVQGDLPFIACCVVVRMVLAALYFRAYYHVPLVRAYCFPFMAGLSLSSLLLFVSLLFDHQQHFSMSSSLPHP